jgi:hypothetical protein
MAAEPTFYNAIVAPTLGAGLMGVIFCVLSPFSGLGLHFALGRATDLTLLDYMVSFDAMVTVVLAAMGLSALCGWLRQRHDSIALSLLSFAGPVVIPAVLVIAIQIAGTV